MEKLINELQTWYYDHSRGISSAHAAADEVFRRMDRFHEENPDTSPFLLKAKLHETIADTFDPALFPHSPFYFEMGVKPSESWGVPFDEFNAGAWMFKKNMHLFREVNLQNDLIRKLLTETALSMFYGVCPDSDHHCFGSTIVIRQGLEGLYNQAVAAGAKCETPDERDFIEAVKQSLLAVKRIACKFGKKAERLREHAEDEESRRFLGMIAATAPEVPWRPCRTFYEGLNTMWFLREVASSIEGMGVSVIGHPDRALIDLYREDLESGRVTEEEALDLVSRFLLPTDNKKDFFNLNTSEHSPYETSTTIMLGGFDEHGNEVCNELTFLFLKAHEKCNLVYPKPNCRFSAASSKEYLGEINRQMLAGRNVFALFNDDCLVEAQVRAGKRLEDARLYVAGGCHEPILEGFEHSAGAANYINMPRILDVSIHEHVKPAGVLHETGLDLERLEAATDFESAYRIVLNNILKVTRKTADIVATNGKAWPRVNPAPFFSSALADCIDKRVDYTAGGGRYNPTAMPMVGFANVVDSLCVLKRLCFDSGRYGLNDLLNAVRADWDGYESLHAEVLALVRFGDDTDDVNAIARRFARDLYEGVSILENERGGRYQLSFFVYMEYMWWGKLTRATPDGRKAGNLLSRGISPSNLCRASATSILNSIAAVDMRQCAANAILDLTLPVCRISPETLEALERTFAGQGSATIQFNCVNEAELRDAIKHPEQHRDLTMRVVGFSARFVTLSQELQEEIINRHQCCV